MTNEISLTLRIPDELNKRLINIAENTGINKSNLLRDAIHRFSINELDNFNFKNINSGNYRMGFRLNDFTHKLLVSLCDKYDVSANQMMIALATLIVEHYAILIAKVYSDD